MSLTRDQVDRFRQRGFVVVDDVFRPRDLEPVRAELTSVIDGVTSRLAALPFASRLARIMEQDEASGREILRRIAGKAGGGHSGPGIFAFLTHAPLLSCVASLVGPEIIGSSIYRVRAKLPRWGKGEVPWHQDSGYTMAHCDRHLMVTCWIPLVDATVENGCLHVVPGVYREGIQRHYTGGPSGYLTIPEDRLLDAHRAEPVEVGAGSALFMTNLTPHASFQNRTDQVRWSIDVRYQSAEVPNNVGEAPEDCHDGRDIVTMACFPPEADFVVRSPAHPEREVRSAESFRALRQRFETSDFTRYPQRWTPLRDRAATSD